MANQEETKNTTFAAQLIQRTKDGNVPWIQISERDAYIFKGTHGSVVVRSRDDDGAEPYVLDLYDARARLVDSFETTWGSQNGQRVSTTWGSSLRDLFLLARRWALGVDLITGSLIEDLDEGRSGDGPDPELQPSSADPHISSPLDELPF